jgi:hypothetical protein
MSTWAQCVSKTAKDTLGAESTLSQVNQTNHKQEMYDNRCYALANNASCGSNCPGSSVLHSCSTGRKARRSAPTLGNLVTNILSCLISVCPKFVKNDFKKTGLGLNKLAPFEPTSPTTVILGTRLLGVLDIRSDCVTTFCPSIRSPTRRFDQIWDALYSATLLVLDCGTFASISRHTFSCFYVSHLLPNVRASAVHFREPVTLGFRPSEGRMASLPHT